MSLGDFLKDVGHAAASGIGAVSSGLNELDKLGGLNPFHVEQGSRTDPSKSAENGPWAAPVFNPVSHQVENVLQAITWTKDNVISQPISTASLMAGQYGDFQDVGHYFSTANWAKSWHAAEHISLGQGLLSMATLDEAQTRDLVNSPLLRYKPGAAYLPPGFDELPEQEQQRILKDAGMPAVGNAYIEEMRQSSKFFKYGSGLIDLAFMWFADPVVLGGKGLSAARRELQVVKRPPAGWSSHDIDQIMDKSVMAKAQDFVWNNRDNPALLSNLPNMNPRLASIAATLKSPDEVHDFFRIGYGDVSAIERLQTKNALAAARVEQDTSRLSALGLMASNFDAQATGRAAQYAALTRSEMERLNGRINADVDLVSSYNRILDHAHEMDSVNLTRWSFARAQQRTEAQAEYRARAARGGKAGYELSHLPPWLKERRAQAAAQGIEVPFANGFVKSRIYGLGDFFSTPVTVVRSFGNARPNGFMRIDDIDDASIAELRGQIARIPGMTDQTRLNMVNEYLKTGTEHERLALLKQIGATGAAKVAEKHGLDPEVGLDIYKEHLKRQVGEIDNMKRYSAAFRERPSADQPAGIRVDEFMDDGGKLVPAPNLVTKLANSHVFQDLSEMDKVFARHSSAIRAIRTSTLGNPDWMLAASDFITHLFKFGVLFRLGYIPRALGDDQAGQTARLGAASMALRAKWGIKNGATNLAMWRPEAMDAARRAVATEGARYAEAEMASIAPDLARLRAPAAPLTPVETRQLAALEDDHLHLTRMRDESRKAAEPRQKVIQGNQPVALPGGVTGPAAFGGREGEMYYKLASGDEALGQIFASNKALVHGHLMRSFDHGGKIIRAADDEALHATSWAHAINAQLVQDKLSLQAIHGASPEELVHWLSRTAEGRAYRQRLGLSMTSDETIANSAWHEVEEYLPTPEIRAKALEPDGVNPGFLKEAVPLLGRPELHTGQVGTSQLGHLRAVDQVMASWYKVAATIPANRMSRHPLFNQLYEGHMQTLASQLQKQGAYDTTVAGVERMATTARRLALRDTKKLVFDIAHRSDAAAALRFISPFMSATTESFQRWARIIADKPQTVGYAANFYNAPIAMGGTGLGGLRINGMQDADGNEITRDGHSYTIDPKTGKAVKRLVPKSERFIVGRMPKWLVDSPVGVAFGAERSSGNLKLSQNSMNIVTQGDPWFHPGVGPIVQIPVNSLVKDKPKAAELARHLGVLPFGPQNGGPFGSGPAGEAASFLLPGAIKNFLTAYDTSDARYQAVKMQIMQRAAYEHSELGKPMPSAAKIASMTKQYWLFSAGSAFLQPMATQRKDAYQFYRDQYNALRRIDPLKADDAFLDRFGESYFVFAQAQSRNLSGVPATLKAVALSKKYGDLIAANPELGALIVGPEGNGPFSPEAYSYQLNHPLTPGDAETQRTKISATEAMQENQRRLGWSKYAAMVNRLTADLHNRGLKSFADKGAEDLKQEKSNYTKLYSQPLYPDGSENPYYIEAWSKDFSTLDDLKYERLIPGLTNLARSPLAAEPLRSDLRVLQQYLGGRQAVLGALAAREAAGGRKTLTAKANADLATQWQYFVDGLIESDTRFGDLHSRYLARDLGYDGSLQEA